MGSPFAMVDGQVGVALAAGCARHHGLFVGAHSRAIISFFPEVLVAAAAWMESRVGIGESEKISRLDVVKRCVERETHDAECVARERESAHRVSRQG